MHIEDKIKNCEYTLKQINHFNPDLYYVNYFFKDYLHNVNEVYEEILEEADMDFGLFVKEKCTLENFEKKAISKKDQKALNFLLWFRENYQREHDSTYTKYIKELINFFTKNNHLPKMLVKIHTKDKFVDDIEQEIKIELHNGKIKSKEELQIEINRQIPIFLKIINQKRKRRKEPLVSKNQLFASSFLRLDGLGDIDLARVCEVYIPFLKRFVKNSRDKIEQLTGQS